MLGQPDEARRLGEAGFAAVRDLGWDAVIDALTT
jgi:hypothetical protein